MTEIHDGKQSVETKRALSTRDGPIIVYFFYPRSSLSHEIPQFSSALSVHQRDSPPLRVGVGPEMLSPGELFTF